MTNLPIYIQRNKCLRLVFYGLISSEGKHQRAAHRIYSFLFVVFKQAVALTYIYILHGLM